MTHPSRFPVLKEWQARAMLETFKETWCHMDESSVLSGQRIHDRLEAHLRQNPTMRIEHKTASWSTANRHFIDTALRYAMDAADLTAFEPVTDNWRWRFLAEQHERHILEPFGLVRTDGMTINQMGDQILIDESHSVDRRYVGCYT